MLIQNLSFVDTDLLIEKKFEMTLEDVKNKFGYQFVRSSEEEMIRVVGAIRKHHEEFCSKYE